MTVLDYVKPGAKFGQVRLVVDLSVSGNVDETLNVLKEMGYEPTFELVSLRSGVHVLAVLKDEQFDRCVEPSYLMDEWKSLRTRIEPKAVHLWRHIQRNS
jgi:hypothetical protein